jgi:hypothetical protein
MWDMRAAKLKGSPRLQRMCLGMGMVFLDGSLLANWTE